jgi:hypothetical protein
MGIERARGWPIMVHESVSGVGHATAFRQSILPVQGEKKRGPSTDSPTEEQAEWEPPVRRHEECGTRISPRPPSVNRREQTLGELTASSKIQMGLRRQPRFPDSRRISVVQSSACLLIYVCFSYQPSKSFRYLDRGAART